MKKLLSILLLFLPIFTIGQTLPAPILKNVSVIANTGDVLLEWEITDSVHIHIIRDTVEDVGGNPYYYQTEIDSIENILINTYTDTYSDADTRSVSFLLRSYLRSHPWSDFRLSNRFNTTFLELSFDTCNSEIDLTWTRSNRLNGLDDQSISEFKIYRQVNTSSFELIGITSDTEYSDQNLIGNSTHTYYVAAITNEFPDYESNSNTAIQFVDIPQTPQFIKAEHVSAQSADLFLQFSIDENSELDTYKLLKSSDIQGNYDTLQTFTTTDFSVQATDINIDVTSDTYYYHLTASNNCGNTIRHSDTVNNIILTIENIGSINSLSWTTFKPISTKGVNYSIYRTDNLTPPLQIEMLSDIYEYSDNIDDIPNSETVNQFCYFIRACENNSASTCISQSNTVCIYNNPAMYLPNAFTPNGDNRNDTFGPVFTFFPEDYSLTIYNRWGQIVFQSNDPTEQWDGKDLSGDFVNSGIYLYYIQLNTPTGNTIKESGNVTVIFP